MRCEAVLATLRPLTDGQVIVVLGAGGDRDHGKRPIMAEIAAGLADVLIVTDDNPRTEDPAEIRAAMLAGTGDGPATVLEIGDRREAIFEAVRRAAPGDVVLIAGKGHETGQEIRRRDPSLRRPGRRPRSSRRAGRPMIEMTLAEIADVVDGTAYGEAIVTGGAFVDTRTPEPGGLFVAVAGERVDGHDFVEQAVAAGAVAVLGSRETAAPTVVVDDVVAALGLLARHVHDELTAAGELTTYALTGSQGKTGTKDYLAAILEGAGPTVATRGNFNNELGVPLTVLRAGVDTSHLVVEMGARGIGHIAALCRIAPPDVAAVVNVGTAHIGEFGSREAIAVAKGEIVEGLSEEGTAVLNAGDPLVAAMAPRTRGTVVTFGTGGDLHATEIHADDLGRPSFDLQWRSSGATVHLAQLGRHQIENALAAAAMALASGLDVDAVVDGLTDARPPSRWRMELHERADGSAVINDAYNANPESMAAALDVLRGIRDRSGRRTIAVLGEMFELGAGSPAAHRQVGVAAARAEVDVLLTIGDAAAEMAEAARDESRWTGEAIVTAGRAGAVTWLRQNVSAGDVVLVKASRGAALELVAQALLDESSDETPAEGSSTR